MTSRQDWTLTLRAIVERMRSAGVTELEVRRGDLRLRVKRGSAEAAVQTGPATQSIAGPDATEAGNDLHAVTAPLTGIFYSAPNPSARPYVEVGEWVEQSTVVGLIETMKVFNEVTADCRGKVAAILADQGQLVHSGETILVVDVGVAPEVPGGGVH